MWQYNELYHHGILGQKWGVRRYQNPDGSLTEEGRRRYGSTPRHVSLDEYREDRLNKAYDMIEETESYKKAVEKEKQFWDLEAYEPYTEKQGQLWDERNKLYKQAYSQTAKELSLYLAQKYGVDRVRKYEHKLSRMNDVLKESLGSLVDNVPDQSERDRYRHVHEY